MHVLSLKFKCKRYSSWRRVIVVPGSGTVNDVSCENNYWRCEIMNDSLFLLGETDFHSVNKHRKESDYFLKQIQYIRHLHQWTRQYVRSTSDFIWSPVLFYDKVTFLKSLNVLERWIFEPVSGKRVTEQRLHSALLRQGQRSTPLTSAVSRVMVNSLSVCRMREWECTAARSRSRAPSSYVRAVRGHSASRGSHWERSRSLPRGTGQWSVMVP